LRAHGSRLSRPAKINLCLTYWCQYRCKTCNIWRRQPKDELTTDELLTFIGKSARTSWLDVTGGEIFLRPDIAEVLLAIVRQWKQLTVLHFPTNGFLTDRILSVTRRLADERKVPIIVTVSLDGDEKLNDEIRGIRGGYRRQVETFNALRGLSGVKVVLGVTLSRYNVGRLRDIYEACRRDCPRLSISDLHVNVAQTSPHYYGNAGGDSPAPVDALRRDLEWYRRTRGLPRDPVGLVESRFLQLLDSYLTTGITPVPCHALRSSCFIDPWGTVFPCISYDRPMGNLRETAMDLEPIWSGEKTKMTAAEIWSGSCPQCWTACEAYQSLLGNVLAPWRRTPVTTIGPHELRES
jgi:radical SAM protein with 4Fe4S-binding SPASM domain